MKIVQFYYATTRLSVLSLEEQLLLALTYWLEYRTLYYISKDFGVNESFASQIIRKVEGVLINSGKFALPEKLPSRIDDDINWTVVVDATETPIERSKKTKKTTTAARRNNTPYGRAQNRLN